MKKIIALVGIMTIICSCHNNVVNPNLTKIDSLIVKNLKDSALTKIKSMAEKDLKSRQDTAYYNMMKTELLFWKGINIPNDSMIDQSLLFYKETGNDKEALARVYYLKGRLMYQRGKRKEGTAYLKEAEKRLDDIADNSLKCKIMINLAVNNEKAQEFELALKCANSALTYAEKANSKELLNDCFVNIGSIYGYLGNLDSAFHYINKCEPLIKYLRKKEQALTYGNLGAAYESRNRKKSKAYILKSIAIEPRDFTYHILASLYLQEDSDTKAEACWHEAMKLSKDTNRKISIMEDVFDYMKERKRYKEASEAADKLQDLKDSLEVEQQRDSIRDVQEYYDALAEMDNAVKEERTSFSTYAMAAATALAIALGGIGLTFYKRNKRRLANKQGEIDRATEEAKRSEAKAEEAEKAKQQTERSLEKLSNQQKTKERKLGKEKAQTIVSGHKLWLGIEDGGKMVDWTKGEVRNFIKYYCAVNVDFAQEVEQTYGSLTDNQYIFLIFCDMGMTNEQIIEAMGLTKEALRTMRSRIKKRKALPPAPKE